MRVTQKLAQFVVDRCNISCKIWRVIPPLRCRKIKSEMQKKALSLGDVAALSGVNYYLVCRLLRFKAVNREALSKVEQAVQRAPMPREESPV